MKKYNPDTLNIQNVKDICGKVTELKDAGTADIGSYRQLLEQELDTGCPVIPSYVMMSAKLSELTKAEYHLATSLRQHPIAGLTGITIYAMKLLWNYINDSGIGFVSNFELTRKNKFHMKIILSLRAKHLSGETAEEYRIRKDTFLSSTAYETADSHGTMDIRDTEHNRQLLQSFVDSMVCGEIVEYFVKWGAIRSITIHFKNIRPSISRFSLLHTVTTDIWQVWEANDALAECLSSVCQLNDGDAACEQEMCEQEANIAQKLYSLCRTCNADVPYVHDFMTKNLGFGIEMEDTENMLMEMGKDLLDADDGFDAEKPLRNISGILSEAYGMPISRLVFTPAGIEFNMSMTNNECLVHEKHKEGEMAFDSLRMDFGEDSIYGGEYIIPVMHLQDVSDIMKKLHGISIESAECRLLDNGVAYIDSIIGRIELPALCNILQA